MSHQDNEDHALDVVPLSERRGPLTLGLLWITMVTGFPSVLVGFEWYKSGLSLTQVLSAAAISCVLLLIYTVPACVLGTRSGQTFALLSRDIFGRWGSWLVSLTLAWVSIGWYGITAVFLAEGLKGLFHLPIDTILFSGILAIVMAFNNFFGFSGVANFARYLAAPVLIMWVGYTFVKACGACPATVFSEPARVSFPFALTAVSSFVIGYGAWGNEADFWRYGKPGLKQILVPLVVSISIGQIIFPATGWMMARLTGITDFAAAHELMNAYAFGGMSVIAAIVLAVTYFAVNDSCLYGTINAIENIGQLPRRKLVAILTVSGALTAAWLATCAHAFESVTSLSCVLLPTASVVMMAEYFIIYPWKGRKADFGRVTPFAELSSIRWAAVTAFVVGSIVGIATAGLVPGLERWHVGVCSWQAWMVSLACYLVLRPIELARAARATAVVDPVANE